MTRSCLFTNTTTKDFLRLPWNHITPHPTLPPSTFLLRTISPSFSLLISSLCWVPYLDFIILFLCLSLWFPLQGPPRLPFLYYSCLSLPHSQETPGETHSVAAKYPVGPIRYYGSTNQFMVESTTTLPQKVYTTCRGSHLKLISSNRSPKQVSELPEFWFITQRGFSSSRRRSPVVLLGINSQEKVGLPDGTSKVWTVVGVNIFG